jgi:predicted esterase
MLNQPECQAGRLVGSRSASRICIAVYTENENWCMLVHGPTMKVLQKHFSELFRAHAAGNYASGLQIARAAHQECPGAHVKTWFWQACMHSLLGNSLESVSALRAGLNEGLWWSPQLLDGEHDLDHVRESPGFNEIREECVKQFHERQAHSRPECLVLAPSTATWEPRSLFVIHRRGDTASQFAEHWGELVNEGWTLIVPQSSQVYNSMGFCWDNVDLARQELRNHLDDSRRKRGIDTDGMVIAGASQGGRLALEVAHESGVPWLCAIPSFPAGYDVSPLIAVPTRTRGAFLLGEQDAANVNSRRVITALESGGVHVVARTMKDVGHDLPEDFPVQVADILRALNSRDTAMR